MGLWHIYTSPLYSACMLNSTCVSTPLSCIPFPSLCISVVNSNLTVCVLHTHKITLTVITASSLSRIDYFRYAIWFKCLSCSPSETHTHGLVLSEAPPTHAGPTHSRWTHNALHVSIALNCMINSQFNAFLVAHICIRVQYHMDHWSRHWRTKTLSKDV